MEIWLDIQTYILREMPCTKGTGYGIRLDGVYYIFIDAFKDDRWYPRGTLSQWMPFTSAERNKRIAEEHLFSEIDCRRSVK